MGRAWLSLAGNGKTCEYVTASIDTTQHDKRTLSTIPAQHIYFTSLTLRTISSEESDGEVLSDETVVNTNVSHPECRLGPRHIIFQSSDDDEEIDQKSEQPVSTCKETNVYNENNEQDDEIERIKD